LRGANAAVDALDSLPSRFDLQRAAQALGIPLVHGAIWGMSGQVSFIHPPETPCLRCLVPQAPPKEVFPVVGVTPGLIGCIQVMEALKFLTGVGTLLKGKLLLIDGEFMRFSTVSFTQVRSCPDCGHVRRNVLG